MNKLNFTGCILAAALLCGPALAANAPVTLQADIITYDASTGLTLAEGNVVIVQEDGEVRAQRAEYDLNNKTGRLTGEVRAFRDDASLTADVLTVRASGHYTAQGSASAQKAGGRVSAPRLDYWPDGRTKTSGGRGRLIQADGSELEADFIEYDFNKGAGLAKGRVEIDAPARSLTGAGDEASYTVDKDQNSKIVLTGNAWLRQNGNKVMGNSLIIRTKDNTGEALGKARLDIESEPAPPPVG